MASALVLPDPGDPFGKLVLLAHEMVPQWLDMFCRPTLSGSFILFSLIVLFVCSPSYLSCFLCFLGVGEEIGFWGLFLGGGVFVYIYI